MWRSVVWMVLWCVAAHSVVAGQVTFHLAGSPGWDVLLEPGLYRLKCVEFQPTTHVVGSITSGGPSTYHAPVPNGAVLTGVAADEAFRLDATLTVGQGGGKALKLQWFGPGSGVMVDPLTGGGYPLYVTFDGQEHTAVNMVRAGAGLGTQLGWLGIRASTMPSDVPAYNTQRIGDWAELEPVGSMPVRVQVIVWADRGIAVHQTGTFPVVSDGTGTLPQGTPGLASANDFVWLRFEPELVVLEDFDPSEIVEAIEAFNADFLLFYGDWIEHSGTVETKLASLETIATALLGGQGTLQAAVEAFNVDFDSFYAQWRTYEAALLTQLSQSHSRLTAIRNATEGTEAAVELMQPDLAAVAAATALMQTDLAANRVAVETISSNFLLFRGEWLEFRDWLQAQWPIMLGKLDSLIAAVEAGNLDLAEVVAELEQTNTMLSGMALSLTGINNLLSPFGYVGQTIGAIRAAVDNLIAGTIPGEVSPNAPGVPEPDTFSGKVDEMKVDVESAVNGVFAPLTVPAGGAQGFTMALPWGGSYTFVPPPVELQGVFDTISVVLGIWMALWGMAAIWNEFRMLAM